VNQQFVKEIISDHGRTFFA